MDPNALSIFTNPDLPVQKYSEDIFNKVVTSADYLPRLQLVQGTSDLCKQGKVMPGNYAYITGSGENEFTGLTNDVDVVLVAWRPKAMSVQGDAPKSYFNPDSETFKNVKEKSFIKDSQCMFGPEYLVWIPKISKFATFFCGSKTMRNEAKNLHPLLGKTVTLKSKLIETEKHTWHGPVALASSVPVSVVPQAEELKEVTEKFLNPVDSEAEVAAPATPSGRAR